MTAMWRLMGIAAALSTALLSGCNGPLVTELASASAIKGSGVVKEETRDVPAFSKLELSQAIRAEVTVGAETSVRVKADDNVLKLVKTEVKGGTLVVGYESGVAVETRDGVMVTITTPALNAITARTASSVKATLKPGAQLELAAHEASRLEASGIQAEKLTIEVTTAGTIVAAGKAASLKATVSAASGLKAADLTVENARVDASAASHAEVNVAGAIDGTSSGASTISISGHPRQRNVSTSGASSVSYP